MQLGTIQTTFSDKPLEIARQRLCRKHGNIPCLGGCVHFGGETQDGNVFCKHEKKCCPDAIRKGRPGRYFTPTQGLATVLAGETLVRLAKAAREKTEV